MVTDPANIPPPPPPPQDPSPDSPRLLRAWVHTVAFCLAAFGSVVFNFLVLMWWIGRTHPPRGMLGITFVLAALASVVFHWSADAVASTLIYRLNGKFAWSLAAGLCYGGGAFWPTVLIALWTKSSSGGEQRASWVVLGLLLWWLIAVPFALGLAFGRLLREIRPDSGLCPGCGYDLRATAGRCPECGRPTR